jgi:hypothetical protein
MTDQTSEGFGNRPHPSATFGTVPQDSEGFGKIPHAAEPFRTLRNGAERTEQHTLTVREVARLFEEAGVPRTERSIINWCQTNHQGVARLDCFFDTNERKYFITPQSVELAIREEQAKQAASGQATATRYGTEPVRKSAEDHSSTGQNGEETGALRNKLRDLEITNRVKDQVIGMMEKERDRLMGERENQVRELMVQSHRIGQLETQLLQLNPATQAVKVAPGEDA